MRVMITGAAGMLGADACVAARADGHEVIAVDRNELDITDAAAVHAGLAEARPDAVINCAAWTDVDGAESAEDAAQAVNGTGAGNVAAASDAVGAWTVHVSTDYVFDGLKDSPYVESDSPNPRSAYGRTKRHGEDAVAAAAPGRHTIVRSSWLFGTAGACFPATIARIATERDEITVVDDQVGCPTFTGHLAPALLRLAREQMPGVLHVAGGGSCSWFQFARAIVESLGIECEVKPGATADLGRPAPRPANSVLVSERGAPLLPDWHRGLAEYVAAGVAAR